MKQKEKIVTKVEQVEMIPSDYEDLQRRVHEYEIEITQVRGMKQKEKIVTKNVEVIPSDYEDLQRRVHEYEIEII